MPMLGKKRKMRPKFGITPVKTPEIIRLWCLRILVPLDGQREFIGGGDFSNFRVAKALGLGQWADPDGEEPDQLFNMREVQEAIRTLYLETAQGEGDVHYPGYLAQNIEKISHMIGLSKTESSILAFAILLHTEEILSDATEFLGDLSNDGVCCVLATILGCPENEVQTSLSREGLLTTSGLLVMDRSEPQNILYDKLSVLSGSFAHSMILEDAAPSGLLRDILRRGETSGLNIDDFCHLKNSLKILVPYLRDAVATGQKGVNIFLYGVPGTGKTELARLLAGEIDCELFEVASEDEDGDAVDGAARLHAFRLAQNLFAQRSGTILLFDEVEDVFDEGFSFFRRKRASTSSKAWINRVLEENPVPVIWISNSAYCLDAAYIRRFDMAIEIPIPPKAQRERIARTLCEDMLPPETISRIAESEDLAPAVIARAVKVAGRIQGEIGKNNVPRSVEHLIDNTMVALGKAKLKKANDPNRLRETYDPVFINADTDLLKVADGLAQTKSGRLCLYGPPGTGKTAFGHWLAEKLNVPLCVKRASDLMSKWVGETEQNIAHAFEEAEEEGALLLIDEMDSFLQERRKAGHSWEVSAVNEMLTQMESFSGVFVASTNIMDGLDQAALRRFDLKVKVDFLQAEQSWQLFQRHCTALSLGEPAGSMKQRIKSLSFLTPGDFAAVSRQNRFRPLETASAFISALERECWMKEEERKARQTTIGFL